MRTPLLTAAAVLSIGLGSGAATSMYSIVDAALFRPPPFAQPNELVIAYITRQRSGGVAEPERWSWARSRLLAARAASFAHVATFSASVMALTGDQPEPVNAELISSAYLAVLGVEPLAGRGFTPGDDEATTAAPAVMISRALWERRFGGERSVIGKQLVLNGVALTVVAILPRGFAGLTGRADAWIPATLAPRLTYADYLITNQNFISVVARMRAGQTLAGTRAELGVLGEQIEREAPSTRAPDDVRLSATAESLRDARIDPATRRPMMVLLAAAGCLLLLSCVNVAGLLLGKGVARRREMAIRVATGASRWRIVRQLLVEASLIAAMGGIFGVLLALPAAAHLAPPVAGRGAPRFHGALSDFAAPKVDVRVLAFCLLLSAVTAIVCGLLPALRSTRIDLTSDLKDGLSGAPRALGPRLPARALIVGAETMLAVVLLVASGLLIADWRRLANTDLGFDHEHLLTFTIRPSEVVYPPARAPALIDDVLAAIERVPGVDAATVDGCAPVGTGCANSTLFVVGRPRPNAVDAPPVLRHYVGPQHFRTLGVPLIRGRVFDARDRAGANRVAIINQTAARRFWPNADPIGQRAWFGGGSTFDRPDSSAEIVGIVGDVAYQSLDSHPFQADFYTPYAQFTYASRTVLVRARADPTALVPALRLAVRGVDARLALFDVRTMDDLVRDSWAGLTYQLQIVAGFAAVALLLATTGIFAAIAQIVSDRRREIGVRAALGATPARVIVAVGDRGARPALIGLAAGLGVSLVAGRFLAAWVYGVRAAEPVVLVVVVGVTGAAILLSSYLAARRALGIAPAEALRYT